MKLRIRLGLWLLAALVLFSQNVGFTQQTGIPHIISYQGQIKSENKIPLSGNHKVSVAFYNNSDGTDMIWNGIYEVNTEGGIFNILLGSGAYPLPEKLDHAIYLGTSIDGGKEMRPLSMLAAVPYALAVADKSITKDKLDLTYLGGISLNGKPITASGSTLNLIPGPGVNLFYDEHTGSLSFYNSSSIGTAHSQSILSDPCGTNVDGGSGTTNVVAGGCNNTANPSSGYAAILGGSGNSALAVSSMIGGGSNNIISSSGNNSVIGGGAHDSVGGDYSFIGSGLFNTVGGQSAVVTGGQYDSVLSSYSFIGGGQYNAIDISSQTGVIVGGQYNKLNLAYGAYIGGGSINTVSAPGGVIVGGAHNTLISEAGFIGGGDSNNIGISYYNTLVGGEGHSIWNADYCFLGGGKENAIFGTNVLSVSTYRADYSVISGGYNNGINGDYSAIAGGRNLRLGSRSFGFNAGASSVDVSGNINIAYFGDVDLWLFNTDDSARKIKFFEPSSGGGAYTSFRAQPQVYDIDYILPAVQGDSLDILINLGDGLLSWGDAATLFTGIAGNGNDWKITGNSNTDPATGNFLGTNNTKPLEFHIFDSDAVNKGSKRVMRFEPNTTSANITGGYQKNRIDSLSFGSVIAGGGYEVHADTILANFGVIGGGFSNKIDTGAHYSFIGGGSYNVVQPLSSVIVGGSKDTIFSTLATTHRRNEYSFIGGGLHNVIKNDNIVSDSSVYSVIVGGHNNTISDSASFIGGGDSNFVDEPWSVIVGGSKNKASGIGSFLGGGRQNFVSDKFSTLVGGQGNSCDAQGTFVGGGGPNLIPGSTKGNDATREFAAIVGGSRQTADGGHSFIGGGDSNFTSGLASFSVITGGENNRDSASHSFIGGGLKNRIGENASFSLISGGDSNRIDLGVFDATIGGGNSNRIGNNGTGGKYCTIPGGRHLIAQSYAQTVLGYFNRIQGTSTQPNAVHPNTINGDDRVFIIGNGRDTLPGFTPEPPDPPIAPTPEVRSNAFEVSNNGHSIVYDQNGSGGATPATVTPRTMFRGGSYTDNVIDAWAVCDWNNTIIGNINTKADFGCANITRTGLGVYDVILNITDPATGTSYFLTDASVTVTLMDFGHEPTNCAIINVTPIGTGNNTFQIKMYYHNTCTPIDHSFSFHVTGR